MSNCYVAETPAIVRSTTNDLSPATDIGNILPFVHPFVRTEYIAKVFISLRKYSNEWNKYMHVNESYTKRRMG